jgi:FMN phosphatase YigB (HAD superfamily)
MRTRQQQLILDMTLHRISEAEFLRETGIARSGASAFALKMLEEAYGHKSEDDVECGLLLAFTFGFSPEFVDALIRLSDADWHHSHEDVVMALDDLRDRRAIDAFYRAALKLHPYLDYDDARALAEKAIWALGNLADPIADEKLRQLARSDHAIVREYATRQLQRREAAES